MFITHNHARIFTIAFGAGARQILARADQESAIALYRSVDAVDLRPQLHAIQQPALILHGAADVILPVASSQWLASMLPHNTLHIFPGAGHVPTVTRPAAVAAQIEAFFRAEQAGA